MRPPEITDQDIIQAGQAVLATGRPVNGFALRSKTGGGKAERLMKVWEMHLSGQTALPTSLPNAELPLQMAEELAGVTKALSERLAALAISLNNQAIQAAERRVHQIQRAADEQSAKDQAALADASVLVDELQAKLGQAESEAEALETQLAEAQVLTEARTGELARLNGLLRDERQSHKDEVELQRAELLEQDQNATRAREALNKELATAKADAAAAQQAQIQQKASDQKRLDAAETERAKASEAAIETREKAARLEGAAAALQAHVDKLMQVIDHRLAAQDAKDRLVAGSVQAETARMIPNSGSPVLQS